MERQGGHLRLRYCLTGRVLSLVQFGFDPKASGCSRTADQVDNSLKCTQWFASPILRDVAEQAVLNLVPLAGPRREMAGRGCEDVFRQRTSAVDASRRESDTRCYRPHRQ